MNLIKTSLALALVALATPLHANDELEGTVLAYDRKAELIVPSDKSVIPLSNLQGEVPTDLSAGDRITVSFQSNEDDGIFIVHSIERL